MTRLKISGETTEGWEHDLGFTYLIFLKIEHYRRVELWCRWWWLVKWTKSFTNDIDKTNPSQSDCSPSRVGFCTVANFAIAGGVVCCGSSQQWWRTRISKVKNYFLYVFTWRIESPIYMENTFHINTLIWFNSNMFRELSPRFAKVKWYERYRWGLMIN